ncbi:Pyrroline-5-carboxylate reductase [Pseudomonas sp. R4-34-07]|uniref:pyrroline-5-carboxylate reductase family protein n=1 Tax=Pseudomonas sp. R4-34-07 TaxID=658642 RepID=UPI000F57BD2F|nr:pyrroline-5-carboxylate reductase dimerization domain-containing protein [Pseudomonas sp. R4-34-07]AZF52871.1 Pyrroline-5-carboxylate reductase [Pseudomonas sp. R4-34-07]
MSAAMNIMIVGGGHMGSAIAFGLKRSSADMLITVVEPDATRRNDIKNAGISTLEELPSPLIADVIFLAIPPQAFLGFLENNARIGRYAGIVISVMAGIRIRELTAHLKNSQIYRTIPNLPCGVNEGMTVLITAAETTTASNIVVNQLLAKLGNLLELKDEALLDSATALVGGGPAYIAYFAAALTEYAISAGFDKSSATSIILQLLHGTTAILEQRKEPAINLCEKVMTAGGTTERAIDWFNQHGVRAAITEGLKISCARSIELGQR